MPVTTNGRNQQPAELWSGRFREPLGRIFEQWQRSFPFDWRLLPQKVAATMATRNLIVAMTVPLQLPQDASPTALAV